MTNTELLLKQAVAEAKILKKGTQFSLFSFLGLITWNSLSPDERQELGADLSKELQKVEPPIALRSL